MQNSVCKRLNCSNLKIVCRLELGDGVGGANWLVRLHAWEDRRAVVTRHVWSESERPASWMESSTTLWRHLRFSCRASSPRGIRCMEPFITCLSLQPAYSCQSLCSILAACTFSLFFTFEQASLSFSFSLHDYCCFSISWPVLPHNQFAQHAHYLLQPELKSL